MAFYKFQEYIAQQGVIIEFPDKSLPHLFLATVTACYKSSYDVRFLEYLATACYKCYGCYSSVYLFHQFYEYN